MQISIANFAKTCEYKKMIVADLAQQGFDAMAAATEGGLFAVDPIDGTKTADDPAHARNAERVRAIFLSAWQLTTVNGPERK